MKSSIHLELTPRDSTSTTTSTYKTCLLNTSCDHQLPLHHTNTSPELQDHSIVGSAEPESILDSEDLNQNQMNHLPKDYGENYNIEHPPFLSLGSKLILWLLDKLEMIFSAPHQLTQI